MTDAIEILEAAYLLTPDEHAWITQVAQVVSPQLGGDGGGLIAFVYDATEPDWVPIRSGVAVGIHEPVARAMVEAPVPRGSETQAMAEVFRRRVVSTLQRELKPNCSSAMQRHLERFLRANGLRDLAFVNATDPTRIGCMFVAPSKQVKRWSPRAANQWRRIASHIAAGFRVRRQAQALACAPLEAQRSEAILRPDGTLEHAAPPAQSAAALASLRRAALAVDRARGKLRRRDPDEAITIWKGLVAGRWSLVDHFDSDGRRYFIAHRNDPEAPDWRGLTRREQQVLAYAALGHSNKLIAYELGLATSTVSVHLARARAKLKCELPDLR